MLAQKTYPRATVRGFTIDAEYSRDLDDAIWISTQGEDTTLYVSIADVASVIIPRSDQFEIALERGETAYLRTRNIPMLPRNLAEDSLSLLPQQTRNCLTVEVRFSGGQISEFDIYEATVCSENKFSYHVADRAIALRDEPFHKEMVALRDLAKFLNTERLRKGAIGAIWLGSDMMTSEDGSFTDKKFFHSQMIVAEVMILANSLVAQWLTEREIFAIFRNHLPKNDAAARDPLLQAFFQIGDIDSIRRQMGCQLTPAEYGVEARGHFALDKEAYCHFTSPIRRCADLIVHQILKKHLRSQPLSYSREELENMSLQLTQKKLERTQMKIAKKGLYQQQIATSVDLSAFNTKDFSRVLEKAAAAGQDLGFEEEIIARTQSNRLTTKDFYCIVFYKFSAWQNVMNHIAQKTDLATSVLAIADQLNGDWSSLGYVIEDVPAGFACRVLFTYKDTVFTTKFVTCQSKSAARHLASLRWLQHYVQEDALIDVEEAERRPTLPEHTHTLQESSSVTVAELPHILDLDLSALPPELDQNYIGQLMECCQAYKWKRPIYEFSKEGPPNRPTFYCTGTITLDDGQPIQKTQSALTKKESQRLAAGALINELVARDIVEFV